MTIFAALYKDEDVSALVATLLRSRGLDVTTVPEQLTLGRTDGEQLELATSMKRCLLTHNRVNFERLHIQYMDDNRQQPGIIIVPQKTPMRLLKGLGFW